MAERLKRTERNRREVAEIEIRRILSRQRIGSDGHKVWTETLANFLANGAPTIER